MDKRKKVILYFGAKFFSDISMKVSKVMTQTKSKKMKEKIQKSNKNVKHIL